MGFVVSMGTDKTVPVIVSKDTAIGVAPDALESAYADYQKDLDEAKLQLSGEPTRFLLRRTLPYRENQLLMNRQVSFEDKQPKVNISFILDEVRFALAGITGPGAEHYAKDSDGYASKELVNALFNSGVLMDLYNARRTAAGETDTPKKS